MPFEHTIGEEYDFFQYLVDGYSSSTKQSKSRFIQGRKTKCKQYKSTSFNIFSLLSSIFLKRSAYNAPTLLYVSRHRRLNHWLCVDEPRITDSKAPFTLQRFWLKTSTFSYVCTFCSHENDGNGWENENV